MEKKIKIVLAQDQELFRQGLRNLFIEYPQFAIIAEAVDEMELLKILRRVDPDIVILDEEMRAAGTKRLLSKISRKYKDIKVIIIGIQTAPEVVHEFIILGARAYLSKYLSMEEFITKLYEVQEVGYAVDQKIIAEFIRSKLPIAPFLKPWLTETELEIYKALKVGKNEADIAEELDISIHTVHSHKKNMFKKTATRTIAEFLNFVEKNGWV